MRFYYCADCKTTLSEMTIRPTAFPATIRPVLATTTGPMNTIKPSVWSPATTTTIRPVYSATFPVSTSPKNTIKPTAFPATTRPSAQFWPRRQAQ